MTNEEIFAGLKEILAVVKPKLDLSTVGPQSSLLGELGIDSLSMLLLSLAIEDKFKIKFDTDQRFESVAQVIEYIANTVE